jgi:hypothetical protein
VLTNTTWRILGRDKQEINQGEEKPKQPKKKEKSKKVSGAPAVPDANTSEDEEEPEEVMMIQVPWMQVYLAYITRKGIQEDPVEARRVIRRCKAFIVVKGELYKRRISGVLQRCVTPEEGRIILKDIHEGICGHHASSRAIAAKASGQDFIGSQQ